MEHLGERWYDLSEFTSTAILTFLAQFDAPRLVDMFESALVQTGARWRLDYMLGVVTTDNFELVLDNTRTVPVAATIRTAPFDGRGIESLDKDELERWWDGVEKRENDPEILKFEVRSLLAIRTSAAIEARISEN